MRAPFGDDSTIDRKQLTITLLTILSTLGVPEIRKDPDADDASRQVKLTRP
ncbi:MAG: hypothetical protein IPP87_25815 [Ideonella sp.]|nr:hypothetical protein [Ideonella sp.]